MSLPGLHGPNRERDVFAEALDLADPEARRAFLERACEGEPELRRVVEGLLEQHREDGFLLPTAAVHGTATLARERADRTGLDARANPTAVPESVGPFRLLEKIGEGGCGAVYLAEQTEPVRRRVALKLIKIGMDTPRVIARFEAERQALALMDHPSIARVLEAGATPQGRPYFVMELVRGVKITDFCEQNRLSVPERIRLVIQVCEAVQHAHQKGIIHRDLKPSNVLVTLDGAAPLPKVIDFGIAKAIHERLTERTLVTGFHAFVGTPAYTSPEQAEMSSLDVDTRSDIYSLGVILYELLTGQTPVDPERLSKSSLDELRRIIREDEPVRPSRRLASTDRSGPLTARTGLPPSPAPAPAPTPRSPVKEDLDWIVMKCLEKDRTRRYSTARELSSDLARFLAQEPVAARPPTAGYKLLKFVRRNRTLVIASTVALLSLAVATTVSTWQAVRATRAEREQTRLRIAAEAGERREAQLLAVAALEREGARRHAYNSDMNLVRQAFDVNNLGRVLDLLDRHRPTAGEADPRQWEWRYYRDQARSGARFAFPKQTSRIAFVTIAGDGRLMLTGDDAGNVKLWDLPGRREIGALSPAPSDATAPRSSVAAAVFSPDASRFALALRHWEGAHRIQVWSTAERRLLAENLVDAGGFGMRFDPTGSEVAYFDATWRRRVWRPEEALPLAGAPTPASRGRIAPFPWPSVSPDGRFAIGLEWPNRLHLTSPTGETPDRVLAAFDGRCAAWAFSPDGSRLAISPDHRADSTEVLMLDVSAGVVEGTLVGNGSWVPALAFSPDGRTLATAGADQLIRLWDVVTRRQTAALRGHLLEVNALAWSPDGSTLVSGSKDGSLLVWDASAPVERPPYRTLPGITRQVAFLAEGDGMLTLDRAGRLHHWDPDLRELEPPRVGDAAEAVEVDRTRNRVVLGLRGGEIQVVDWATRLVVTNVVFPRGSRPGTRLSTQGRRLIAMNADGAVGVWDLDTWVREAAWNTEAGPIFDLAVSGDAQRLAVSGTDATIRWLRLRDGREEYRFEIPTIGGWKMAFSPRGDLFAQTSRDGVISFRDAGTGKALDDVRGHLLGVHGICFSPDGERWVSTSIGRESIKLWDVRTRHEVATLETPTGALEAPSFSPDGTWLIAIAAEGSAYAWHAPSLRRLDVEVGPSPARTPAP